MLPIYICEDEQLIRQHITSHISDYYTFHSEYERPEIHAFSEPYSLLAALPDKPEMGIYLLDVQFDTDINGLDLAQRIRDYDPRGFIVFITSHAEYAPKTFKLQVEAFDYINKSSSQLNATISLTLSKIHERYSLFQDNTYDNPRIELHFNRHTYFYFANDLIAITTSDYSHKIKLLTVNGSVAFSGSLSKIKHDLPSSHFIQCHRAYIINKNHIKTYDPMAHTVELSNQLIVPVSRENRPFFR